MTQSAPPRKPRRVQRWAWLATVATLALMYAMAYASLRASGTLLSATVRFANSDRNVFRVHDPEAILPTVTTWRKRLFRPCIVVEEWWRNR